MSYSGYQYSPYFQATGQQDAANNPQPYSDQRAGTAPYYRSLLNGTSNGGQTEQKQYQNRSPGSGLHGFHAHQEYGKPQAASSDEQEPKNAYNMASRGSIDTSALGSLAYASGLGRHDPPANHTETFQHPLSVNGTNILPLTSMMSNRQDQFEPRRAELEEARAAVSNSNRNTPDVANLATRALAHEQYGHRNVSAESRTYAHRQEHSLRNGPRIESANRQSTTSPRISQPSQFTSDIGQSTRPATSTNTYGVQQSHQPPYPPPLNNGGVGHSFYSVHHQASTTQQSSETSGSRLHHSVGASDARYSPSIDSALDTSGHTHKLSAVVTDARSDLNASKSVLGASAVPQHPTTVDPNQVFNQYEYQQRKAAAEAEARSTREAAQSLLHQSQLRANVSKEKLSSVSRSTVSHTPAPAHSNVVAAHMVHPHDAPNEAGKVQEEQIRAEMKSMLEKMREYSAKDPALFSQIWEQVKKAEPPGRKPSQVPLPSQNRVQAPATLVGNVTSSIAGIGHDNGQLPDQTPTTRKASSSNEDSVEQLPDLGRFPAQRRRRRNGAGLTRSGQSPKSLPKEGHSQISDKTNRVESAIENKPPSSSRSNMIDENIESTMQASYRESEQDLLVLPADQQQIGFGHDQMRETMQAFYENSTKSVNSEAYLQRLGLEDRPHESKKANATAEASISQQPSLQRASTPTIWPENRKTSLATAAKIALTSNAANEGKKISSEEIRAMLDRNPSYAQLCELFEKRGFVIERSQFARLLLAAVPDVDSTATAPARSPVRPVGDSNQPQGQPHRNSSPPRKPTVNRPQTLPPQSKQTLPTSETEMKPFKAISDLKWADERNLNLTSNPPESNRSLLRTKLVNGVHPGFSPLIFPGSQILPDPNQPVSIVTTSVPTTLNTSTSDLTNGHPLQSFQQRSKNLKVAPLTKAEMARKRSFSDIVDLTQDASEGETINVNRNKRLETGGTREVARDSPQSYPERHTGLSIGNSGSNGDQIPTKLLYASVSKSDTNAPIMIADKNASTAVIAQYEHIPVDIIAKREALKSKLVINFLDKKKALRRSTYNPKTIARDVLISTGRHPRERPLNWHLKGLQSNFGNMYNNSDISTFPFNLVDPVGSSLSNLTEAANAVGHDVDEESDTTLNTPSSGIHWQRALMAGDDDVEMGGQREGNMALIKDDLSTASVIGRKKPSQRGQGRKPRRRSKILGPLLSRKPLEAPNNIARQTIAGQIPNASSSTTKGENTDASHLTDVKLSRLDAGVISLNQSIQASGASAEMSIPHRMSNDSFMGPSPSSHTNVTPSKRRGRPPGVIKKPSNADLERNSVSPAEPKRRGRPPGSKNTMSSQNLSSDVQIAIPVRAHQNSSTPIRPSNLRNASTPSDRIQVMLPSRSPTIISTTESGQKRSAISNEQVKRSRGRPSKQQPSNLTYKIYKCLWKACQAELHNLETLRKHITKLHCNRSQEGTLPCLWHGCVELYPQESGRSPRLQAFLSDDLWIKHVEKHIEPLAWELGDGPSTHPSDAKMSDYLSDNQGRQVTPLISEEGPEDPFYLDSDRRPARAYHKAHGNTTDLAKAKAVLEAAKARKKALGAGMEDRSPTFVTDEMRAKLVDDANSLREVDEDEM